MNQALATLGLTPSRTHLLWELGSRGPVPQRVLADALKVTPRAITGLVDALVAAGLVTREPHPNDRRAALVTLTPTAEALVGRLRKDHARLAQALFGTMPDNELERFSQTLVDIIDRLQTHLAAKEAPTSSRQAASRRS